MALALFFVFAKEFVLPVVLAFFIAMTFRPIIRILAHRHIPEWLTAGAFIVIVTVVGGSLIYALMGSVRAFMQDAPNYVQIFKTKFEVLQSSFGAFMNLATNIQHAAQPGKSVATQEVVVRDGSPLAYIGQITGYSISIIASIVLTLVIAAFLMASGDLFYAKMVRVLPTLRDKKTALRIVYDVEHEVSSYLLIVSSINALLGLAVSLSFFALDMPTPFLWGAVAFALNFIPYIGALTGIGLAAFISIVTFDSLAYAALIPMSYALFTGLESQIISPLFLGRRLQLNSVAILLALAFWTWLWGIAGTMVAVPILVTVKVFCDHLEGLSGIGEFLSAKYPEEQPANPELSKI